jgi:hypothetical protein
VTKQSAAALFQQNSVQQSTLNNSAPASSSSSNQVELTAVTTQPAALFSSHNSVQRSISSQSAPASSSSNQVEPTVVLTQPAALLNSQNSVQRSTSSNSAPASSSNLVEPNAVNAASSSSSISIEPNTRPKQTTAALSTQNNVQPSVSGSTCSSGSASVSSKHALSEAAKKATAAKHHVERLERSDQHADMAARAGAMGRVVDLVTAFNEFLRSETKVTCMQRDAMERSERLLLHVYNVAIEAFNELFPNKKRPKFPSTLEGASELLAIMVELQLNTRPHPSWIAGYKPLTLRYTLVWHVYYMADLPEGVLPEQIIHGIKKKNKKKKTRFYKKFIIKINLSINLHFWRSKF